MKSILTLSCTEFHKSTSQFPYYSYSKLAKFYREGPKGLISEEKIETDSLRFGSLVDCILTNQENFKNLYLVADIPKISASVRKIIETVFQKLPQKVSNLKDVDKDLLLSILHKEDYYPNYKDEKKLEKIIKTGSAYFNLLFIREDKIIISQDEYNEAVECVQVLKNSPFTKKFITDNPFNSQIETQYQVKFEGEYHNIGIRGIFDKLIVDHQNKVIIPIDLKTTGSNEENFPHSVVSWNYWIQADLYMYMLSQAISKDDYFKDFKIEDFRFIVINRYTKSPIVWVLSIPQLTEVLKQNHIKSWKELILEAYWHDKYNKYDYSYETYQANGERYINLNTIFNE